MFLCFIQFERLSEDLLSELNQIDTDIPEMSPLPSPVDDLVNKIEAFSSESSLANVEKLLARANEIENSDNESDSFSENYVEKVFARFLDGRSMSIDWELIPNREQFIKATLAKDIPYRVNFLNDFILNKYQNLMRWASLGRPKDIHFQIGKKFFQKIFFFFMLYERLL